MGQSGGTQRSSGSRLICEFLHPNNLSFGSRMVDNHFNVHLCELVVGKVRKVLVGARNLASKGDADPNAEICTRLSGCKDRSRKDV